MFPLINVDVLRNSCHKEGTTEWEDSSLVAQCARWGRFRFLPGRFQTELQKLWKPSPASNFVSGSCFDTGFALVRPSQMRSAFLVGLSGGVQKF